MLMLPQRSSLGDPSFVKGLDTYQQQMLSDTTGAEVRSRISDVKTLNVSAYDPQGLESLSTYVFMACHHTVADNIPQTWYFSRCRRRRLRHGNLRNVHHQPLIRVPYSPPRYLHSQF